MVDRRDTATRRTSAVLGGLLAVAITAAALAGAALHVPKSPGEDAAQSSLRTSRTMVCASTPTKSSLVSGSVEGAVKRTDATSKVPAMVRAEAGAATTAYATQTARGANWFTAQECAEPSAEQWFVGAGGSGLHSSTLQLTNIRSGKAIVDVEVLGADGPVEAPGLRGITVGRTPVSLDISKVAPALDDLVIRVNAIRGLVAANVTDVYTPGATAKTTTEWLPGTAEPDTTLTLGGLGEAGTWTMMVFNSGDDSAVVDVEYVGDDGAFAPTGLEPVTAAPGKLTEVELPKPDGPAVQGIRLSADQPLVAGVRSRVAKDVLHAQRLTPTGLQAVSAVPEKSGADLRFINPDPEGSAKVTARILDEKKKELDVVTGEIGPGAALKLTSSALSKGPARIIVVETSQPILGWVELRPSGSLRATLPLRSAVGEVNVPAVRAGS